VVEKPRPGTWAATEDKKDTGPIVIPVIPAAEPEQIPDFRLRADDAVGPGAGSNSGRCP
jgi:hypothetical protein